MNFDEARPHYYHDSEALILNVSLLLACPDCSHCYDVLILVDVSFGGCDWLIRLVEAASRS